MSMPFEHCELTFPGCSSLKCSNWTQDQFLSCRWSVWLVSHMKGCSELSYFIIERRLTMQRSSSGIFQSIVPSAHRPPRPPSRCRSSPSEIAATRQENLLRDLEKGEKQRWKLRAEQAVHLIPVVLLACLFVLYICSSLPVQGGFVARHDVNARAEEGKTRLPNRRLQQANSREDRKGASNVGHIEVTVSKHDGIKLPLRFRGMKDIVEYLRRISAICWGFLYSILPSVM